MRRIALLCLLGMVACKKGDDCQQVFDKMSKSMKELSGMQDKFLDQCRKNHDKFVADPVMKCVLDASGDDAVNKCMKKGFDDYAGASKSSEAALQLNKIGKNAKVAFATNGAFPTGKAKTLPAGDTCCKGDKGKCAVTTDWASDPVWKALDFSIDEPSLYRYSYESADGKSFTATAVGDTDCDGQNATFTLTGKVDQGGTPSIDLQKPPAGQY